MFGRWLLWLGLASAKTRRQSYCCVKDSQAEAIAYREFENSKDPYAFFLALSAIYQDERYFDCLDKIESNPEILHTQSSILGDLNRIALNVYIQTRQIDKAENAIAQCLSIQDC